MATHLGHMASQPAIIKGFATPPRPMTTPEDTSPAPAEAPFMRTIKSYVLRAGRMGTGQMRAFELYGPRFLIPY